MFIGRKGISKQKGEGIMKRILMVIVLIVLLIPMTASAKWYLACDPSIDATVTGVEFRVNGGTAITGIGELIETEWYGTLLLVADLTPYEDGQDWTLEARFVAGVTPGWWSIPFLFNVNQIPPPVGAPTDVPGLRLIQQ